MFLVDGTDPQAAVFVARVRETFERYSPFEQQAFLHRFEKGEPQSNVELQDLANALYRVIGDVRQIFKAGAN